jgi:subtilisin family serine protease
MELRHRNRILLILPTAWTLLAPLPGGTQGTAAPGGAFELRLRTGSFDPLLDAPILAVSHYPEPLRSAPPRDDLVLIQFTGPPLPEWLTSLRGEGVVIFDYVPRNAYLARARPDLILRVRARPFVRAVAPYLPAFRVAPGIALPGSSRTEERVRLLVQGAPDRSPASLAAAFAGVAPRTVRLGAGRHAGASMVEFELDRTALAGELPSLASIPDLFWIEERRPYLPDNNEMKRVMQTGPGGDTRLFSKGLTGTGQIIGESDSGLDHAHCFFVDPAEPVVTELIDPDSPPAVPVINPAHRKVLAYQYHVDSDTIDQGGHGTHVAGTAAGDDLAHPASGSDAGLDLYDGMAPAARLVFQDVDRSGGFLEIPVNLYGYLESAYDAGARIHTNSWSADTTDYTSDSSQVDRFAWDHPDILFLFSAGNRGPNPGTVGAPATAKNVIAVGMVQTPASGDPNNLDSLSSNGPTSDGRRKPEVVNVGGSPIPSAAAGTPCGIISFGGTSMATPGVAGGAALVRQYLTQGYYPHGYAGSGPPLAPSAALVKAVVVNSAVNITGTDVDAPIPDNSQGWGRVLLDNAVFFPNDLRRLVILKDDDTSTTTDGFPVGSAATETFQVFNCRQDVPMKVTLVWTEPPVAPTSGQAWVNDLDLEVSAPGGALYKGNVFSSGVSAPGGAADSRHNLEQVLLPGGALPSGAYTVRVTARNVAVGPQPYALVVTGDVSAAAVPRLAALVLSRSGGCDGDPFLDEGETLDLSYSVSNQGCGASGPIEARLVAGTPLPITIEPSSLSVVGLPPAGTTTASFRATLGDTGGICAGEIPLLLTLETQDGARAELTDTQLLRLDPAQGSRTTLDNVETGDRSVSRDAGWQIDTCRASSPTRSWHMGDPAPDCNGIVRDALPHSIVFETSLAPGERLATASFVHAFDGYSNASFRDSIHFEIDHDLDGIYDPIASWSDGAAPTSMSPAGPFGLSSFNQGRASTVRFRFRFQSAALWVGPNQAPGWNVDDFRVNVDIFAGCDVNSKQPPGNVGATLRAGITGADVVLSWSAPSGAASYRVLRSESRDLTAPSIFSTPGPTFVDTGTLQDPRSFFYKVFALSGCGVVSAD